MSSATVGYARTSTADQKAGLEAQRRDLEAAGCTKIFSEQVSSVSGTRPKLEAALDYVREGDTLVVVKLDRLARSVADLVTLTARLKEKGVELRILAMSLDTGTPTGKLMLNLLGSIAEFERELMLERQKDGIAKAKAEGAYMGRAPVPLEKVDAVVGMKEAGETADAIAEKVKIGRASVFRILKDPAKARENARHWESERKRREAAKRAA